LATGSTKADEGQKEKDRAARAASVNEMATKARVGAKYRDRETEKEREGEGEGKRNTRRD